MSIYENQLEEFAANKAIRQFILRETGDSKFSLIVVLTWKDGENLLINARRQARVWPKLNTLASYIKGLQCLNTPISLELNYESIEPN